MSKWHPNKKGRGETAPTFLSFVIFFQYIRIQCESYLALKCAEARVVGIIPTKKPAR